MRIAFCDDDPFILAQLQKYVTKYFHTLKLPCPEYAVYSSGDELMKNGLSADIAFLDVEMPGVRHPCRSLAEANKSPGKNLHYHLLSRLSG